MSDRDSELPGTRTVSSHEAGSARISPEIVEGLQALDEVDTYRKRRLNKRVLQLNDQPKPEDWPEDVDTGVIVVDPIARRLPLKSQPH